MTCKSNRRTLCVLARVIAGIAIVGLIAPTVAVLPYENSRSFRRAVFPHETIENPNSRRPGAFHFGGRAENLRSENRFRFVNLYDGIVGIWNTVNEIADKVSSSTIAAAATKESTEGLSERETMLSPASVSFDFDGDGKADPSTWRGSQTEIKVLKSSNGSLQTVAIGSSAAKAAPGDYDGDGKTDAAVFNSGTWTVKKSSDNSTATISHGASGDLPVSGDYDGDGVTDAAVFRPSTGD